SFVRPIRTKFKALEQQVESLARPADQLIEGNSRKAIPRKSLCKIDSPCMPGHPLRHECLIQLNIDLQCIVLKQVTLKVTGRHEGGPRFTTNVDEPRLREGFGKRGKAERVGRRFQQL